MVDFATYFHRVTGATRLFTIDGDSAIAAHPNEWSTLPWTDATAAAAEQADAAAMKRARDELGRPRDRVGGNTRHAEATTNPPVKPFAVADQGLMQAFHFPSWATSKAEH